MTSTEKGDVFVVWVDKNNLYFSSIHENDTKFHNPILLSSNNTVSFSPQIAATEKGDVYVVWVDKNNATGDSNVIFRGSNDGGNNFDHTIRLNRNVNPNQISTTSYPQIAATEKGDVYVVWVDKNNATGDSNIRFRSSNNNGKNFDRTVVLNMNPNQISISYLPKIGTTQNGSVYVVWSEDTLKFKEILDDEDIFGRTISLSSSLVLPISLQIDVIKNGNIYLAWSEKRGNASNDIEFVFKKISEFYFDRN